MYYDAHTHLNDNDLYINRKEIIDEFKSSGGEGLVNVGINTQRNERAVSLVKEFGAEDFFVGASLGLHPGEVVFSIDDISGIQQRVEKIRQLYNENSECIYAIGEGGIDNHYKGALEKIELQKEALEALAGIARELGLPLVVHSRDGFEETFDVLKKYKDMKIYFHCWGYGSDEFKEIQNNFDDFRVGFAGNVTYPKADELREALKNINLDSLLLETDAPYLAPQIKRGKKNTPVFLSYIYEFVAEFFDMKVEDLSEKMKTNFRSFYNL